ncbi:coagulation factor IX [Lampris incognitus]|uniref:coagulation factor IX n=1 Tax=Lampris incognitus TaxID=2546036 RepID=UPI0024B5E857|nr:coagulation factor IX [Lampris incognitus]
MGLFNTGRSTFWILLLSSVLECHVFLDRRLADQLFRSHRRRRANSFLEEVLPGNLERECYEEACSQEEAAEIFQSREKTLEFWYRYARLNPCAANPCLNGGICTLDRGNFLCLCPPQYDGRICGIEVLQCEYRNGGCLHYCEEQNQLSKREVLCGCADGYKLDRDGRGCSKTVEFPCGKNLEDLFYHRSETLETDATMENRNVSVDGVNVTRQGPEGMLGERGANETWSLEEEEEEEDDSPTRIVGGLLEKQGGSPWQVLIHRADGYGFCGGALVSDRWVVSAAHCFQEKPDHVTVGNYDKLRPDPGEQQIKVEKVFVHPHFHAYTYDSDIALLYLAHATVRSPAAIPVCLPNVRLSKYLLKVDNRGVVTGWGAMQYLGRSSPFLRKVVLPVVSQKNCRLSTEQVVTENMFCAGYLDIAMDACSGDSGGPFVVNFRETWFLAGVVSWGEECAAKGKYGVYTRLGNYLDWIRDTMETQEANRTAAEGPNSRHTFG